MGVKNKRTELEIVESNNSEQPNSKKRKLKDSTDAGPHKYEKKPGKNFFSKPHNDKRTKKTFIQNDPNEKVDWKKLKQEKKELKTKRKLKRDKDTGNEKYELSVQAKKIWEELRREDCKGGKKERLAVQLYDLIKGKAKFFIYAHDTVRVIETLVGASPEKYKEAIYQELKPEFKSLTKNNYARFFVLKFLRCGTKNQKNGIIESFKGSVIELMKHKVACDVVELAYNDYANAKQRSCMLQEFFGPHFRLFKDENVHTLEDALKLHPEKKDRILKDVNEILTPIIEKGVFTNSMIHTLIRQYLGECSSADRSTMIESIRENLLPIIHTRDGARVGMTCIWFGNNKDRKIILKSFKGHYLKIATEEFSYMVLLAAFDCIDDTVFLKKAVLSEVLNDMKMLAATDHGRRVLRYLIAPRSKIFFHPDIIKVLSIGDGNPSSKKDTDVRRKEIQEAVSGRILDEIYENINEWVFHQQWTLFIGEALKVLYSPILENIFKSIGEICSEPYVPGGENHVLENCVSTKLITYLIKTDKDRAANKVRRFSTQFVEEVGDELKGWINCNRGCFILVHLIETEIPSVVEKIKEVLEPFKDKIKEQTTKGAEVLIKKIE